MFYHHFIKTKRIQAHCAQIERSPNTTLKGIRIVSAVKEPVSFVRKTWDTSPWPARQAFL